MKNKNECCAVSGIPAKTSYVPLSGSNKATKNEIYYFGNPPKKPETLSNYLKKSNKKDKDSK